MEVEVKFRVYEGLKEKIESIAKFVKEVREEDYYLIHPCRDLRDEALRIRRSDGVYLTYKGPRVDRETKTREEIEVEVSDFEGLMSIFKKLGFEVFARVSKVRRIYRLGDFKICIDKVDGLGEFVEIEVKDGEKDEVLRFAKSLGLVNSITLSYLEMLRVSQ